MKVKKYFALVRGKTMAEVSVDSQQEVLTPRWVFALESLMELLPRMYLLAGFVGELILDRAT